MKIRIGNVDTTIFVISIGIELVPLSGFVGTTDVIVDRPFVFVIRDVKRRVPIFVGRVLDPRQ